MILLYSVKCVWHNNSRKTTCELIVAPEVNHHRGFEESVCCWNHQITEWCISLWLSWVCGCDRRLLCGSFVFWGRHRRWGELMWRKLWQWRASSVGRGWARVSCFVYIRHHTVCSSFFNPSSFVHWYNCVNYLHKQFIINAGSLSLSSFRCQGQTILYHVFCRSLSIDCTMWWYHLKRCILSFSHLYVKCKHL